MVGKVVGKYVVSIHAPVMGAKAETYTAQDDGYVSIHAPVMGAN